MRTLVVILVSICLIGCTTLQPIDAAQPQAIAGQIHVGDKVRAVGKDGRVYNVEITAIERDGFRGKNDRGEGRLRYADLKSLEVEKVSGWKVFGWTVTGVAVTYVVTAATLIAIVLAAW